MSMQVFEVSKPEQHLCLLIGLGLIGQQVSHFLGQQCPQLKNTSNKPTNWTQPNMLIEEISSIAATHPTKKLDVVWCAGKCGFNASDADMEQEYNVYCDIMQFLSRQAFQCTINFLSSAGGIYEGAAYVSNINDIAPLRPYAFWKLKQENILSTLSLKHRIFRISSVYGYKNSRGRMGLINALIENSLKRKSITIYANQNTLRDYIFHNDIARHIVERIKRKPGDDIELLVNGRGISISTLMNMVKNTTRMPIKALFRDTCENSKDIVFDDRLIPASFSRTSLEEGIRAVYSRTNFS